MRRTTVRPSLPTTLRCILSSAIAELFKNANTEGESAPKILYLGVSSDGGLCGGIHSSISRLVKREMATTPGDLAVIGDKPKAQLSRAMPQSFKVSFNSVGKDVPTFAEASAIADEITKNGGDWDEVGLPSPGMYGY